MEYNNAKLKKKKGYIEYEWLFNDGYGNYDGRHPRHGIFACGEVLKRNFKIGRSKMICLCITDKPTDGAVMVPAGSVVNQSFQMNKDLVAMGWKDDTHSPCIKKDLYWWVELPA